MYPKYQVQKIKGKINHNFRLLIQLDKYIKCAPVIYYLMISFSNGMKKTINQEVERMREKVRKEEREGRKRLRREKDIPIQNSSVSLNVSRNEWQALDTHTVIR